MTAANEGAWTPGPIVVLGKQVSTKIGGFYVIGPGYGLAPCTAYVCSKADADLYAAAPDLVEACEDALAGWNYIRSAHGDLYGVGWDRVEKKLSAALSKARGETGGGK